jgi:hypothetical protein
MPKPEQATITTASATQQRKHRTSTAKYATLRGLNRRSDEMHLSGRRLNRFLLGPGKEEPRDEPVIEITVEIVCVPQRASRTRDFADRAH